VSRKRTDTTTARRGSETGESASVCLCGETLTGSGRCPNTGLYSRAISCPFVCPICRGPLDWVGGCERCHGSVDSGDRDTWTFPGDRYEHQACSWVRIDGPRKACTRAENLEAITMVLRVLERMGNSGPIPIGACPAHPDGCGRSGRLEPARMRSAPILELSAARGIGGGT